MNKCLVFEIQSEFGYFKRYNSTSSPTTHNIIPKTTLIGLISAIIGNFNGIDEKDVYLNYFDNDNCKIALEVLNPIKKTFFGLNYQNIKDLKQINAKNLINAAIEINKKGLEIQKELFLIEDFHKYSKSYDRGNKYTQVNMEVIRKPHYRVYFYHSDDNIYNLLKDRLFKGEVYYPIFMGTTDFPCVIKNVSEETLQLVNEEGNLAEINSVVPENIANVKIHYTASHIDGRMYRNKTIIKEKQPYLFVRDDNYRRNIDFIELNISEDGSPILAEVNNYYICNDKRIIFY